ncbi:CDP-glycerol glycerophosphotransferase family protein [Alkanindiges illinoisensis]|uniref:CDP-glycerol glycerophosphotransferase family protein n=1 Tax=Alkanindiges illinoisensis TaxID=197183 RepID=UPI0004791EE1|nr:CDP-glycerol glycerophosphotransferase family protein [Alkanindiges illinoisensis]
MSKITKLINTPNIFFKDMAYKTLTQRLPMLLDNLGNRLEVFDTSPSPAKKVPVTKRPVSSTKADNSVAAKTIIPSSINLSHINLLSPIYHIIHTGEGMTHGPSHLSLWIPTFLTTQISFAVIVRNVDLYNWVVEKYPFINVAYAKTPIDIENLLNNMAFLKGIFYPSNTGNNIHCLRFNVYEHIFIGHGDSDKSASAHKFFRVYDQVWVAGQAHIDRFKNAQFNTNHIDFVKVGRPNLSSVLEVSKTPWHKRMVNNVLYLPTWEGVYEESNYSSLRLSGVMLQSIIEKFGLLVSTKLHPVTGSRDPSLKNIQSKLQLALESKGKEILFHGPSINISELVLRSNLFICDISAVVSECLAADAPIFVYIPKDREINVSQSDMNYEDYCYTFSTVPELLAKIEQVLQGDDYLRESRRQAMEYILSANSIAQDQFAIELRKLAEKNYLIDNMRMFVQQ